MTIILKVGTDVRSRGGSCGGGGGFDRVWGGLGWSSCLESGVWDSLQEVHTVWPEVAGGLFCSVWSSEEVFSSSGGVSSFSMLERQLIVLLGMFPFHFHSLPPQHDEIMLDSFLLV